MKKFYLLMMFALLGMVANAAEVVTTSTFESGLQGTVTAGQVVPSDKLTWTVDKAIYVGWDGNNNRGVQLGSSSNAVKDGVTLQTTETFTNVKKVDVYLSVASKGSASVSTFVGETQMGVATDFSNTTPEVYTFEGDPVSGNISLVLKSMASKALYVQKVVIYSEEADPTQVATPTFSVEGGEYYNAQSIALSCVTADASIFYTINDGAETAYEAPIELSESGGYTIKAWATKEGLENSEVVSKTYTLKIGEQPMSLELNIENYCTNAGIGNSDDLFEIIYNNVKFTATNGTSNPPKYYTSDKTWRIYVGASLTITAPDGFLVESVNINASKATISSVDSGTLDGLNWVASGNTQSVKFNIGGTTQIKSITVTLKEADSNQVAAPTFSLTSGTYEGTQSLSLNCETEGATIYYTMNGGETQTYADAIELTEGNEYAFVAWAEKDGMTKSSEVTANYTIVAPLVANSIAEFLTLGAEYADREITLNCDLTVTYQGGGNEKTRDLYVKDAEGKGLLIFGVNSAYNNGNIIPAGLKGKLEDYNGLPELVNPSNFGEVILGEEVSPEVFTAATITANDLSKYIVLNEVTLTALDKNKNGTLTDASGDVEIRDNGYCEYPTDFSKKYDVTAVVATYWSKIQVYPTEIVEHTSSSVNDAVANEFKAVAVANGIEVNVVEAGLVSVYNAAGQLVANVNVAEGATTINVAGGFYIVKVGNNVAKVLVK